MLTSDLGTGTSAIAEYTCKIAGREVTLVDTPGFDDTTLTDTEVLTMIASWMADSYDSNIRLTGVIYLHRITDNRVAGSSYKNLRMLRSLCGDSNLANVVLTTTMWDKVGEREGNEREKELLNTGNFWGDLKKDRAKVRRLNDSVLSAAGLVEELITMSPVTLKIQKEIAIEKKTLDQTDAGRSVDEALNNLKREHKENLAMVTQDLQNAIRQG